MSFLLRFSNPFGAMFASPEQHAENGPDTWSIVKDPEANARNRWAVRDAAGRTLSSYATKRDATEARTTGELAQAHERDTRWYGGASVPGRRDWQDIVESSAKEERKARRVVERIGSTPEQVAEWKTALTGLRAEHDADAPTVGDEVGLARQGKRVEAALLAMEGMLDLLTSGDIVDPSYVDASEARDLHRELAESHGFTSSVDDHIHRIEYLGLDCGKSALDVLHDMRDEEREASQTEWRMTA